MERELNTRALRLLATREHSRAELRAKLAGEAAAEVLEAVLDRLVALGFQSDQRFAESYVRTKAARLGESRLRYELARRGVAEDIIERVLSHLSSVDGAGDEFTRAREVWSKKFGDVPQDPRSWAKQARFLQSRGFSSTVIRQLLKDVSDEPAAGW